MVKFLVSLKRLFGSTHGASFLGCSTVGVTQRWALGAWSVICDRLPTFLLLRLFLESVIREFSWRLGLKILLERPSVSVSRRFPLSGDSLHRDGICRCRLQGKSTQFVGVTVNSLRN